MQIAQPEPPEQAVRLAGTLVRESAVREPVESEPAVSVVWEPADLDSADPVQADLVKQELLPEPAAVQPDLAVRGAYRRRALRPPLSAASPQTGAESPSTAGSARLL